MPFDKRKRLAAVCIVCFALLVMFLLTNRFEDLASNPAFSFIFKLAISAGVLWLAWPDLIRLKDYFPPKFLILAPIALAALLIQPRFGAGLVSLTIIYWIGWGMYRKVFPQPNKSYQPPANKTQDKELPPR